MYKIIDSSYKKNSFLLKVEFSGQDWKKKCQTFFDKQASSLKLDGFRKGKIPTEVAKKYVDEKTVFFNTAKYFLQENYNNILSDPVIEKNNKILDSSPSVDIEIMDKNKVVFVLEFEVYPKIKLPNYKKLGINIKKTKFIEADFKKYLDSLMENYAEMAEKENGVVEENDIVIIDFEGKIDNKIDSKASAKNYELRIGSNHFIPGFETSLVGMKKGEQKIISLQFPENYSDENYRNKKVEFTVKVNEVKIVNYPKLDDALAKEISNDDKMTAKKFTEEKKKDYVENINKQYIQKCDEEIRKQLLEKTEFSYLPQKMVDSLYKERLDSLINSLNKSKMSLDILAKIQNTTKEQILIEFKNRCCDVVKLMIIIEDIAKFEKINFTKKQVEEFQKSLDSNDNKNDYPESIKTDFDIAESEMINKKVWELLHKYNCA